MELARRVRAWLAAPLAWVLLAFVLSRAIAHAAGVRFDARAPERVWHVLDLGMLQGRFWESLWHLHGQPPLFNAFLGAGLKGFGPHAAGFFQATYVAFGLVLAAALHRLMVRLGVGERLAAGVTIAFVVSPSAILYENWLLYTHPLAALLVLAAWAFHRLVTRPTTARSLAFFGLLVVIAGIRPLYHPVWIAAAAGLLLLPFWHQARARRAILVGAVLPLVLLVALFSKNAFQFGTFGSSTWLGMNLARITVGELNPERKAALVATGKLSPLALHAQFQPLSAYPQGAWRQSATGIPVLDAPLKQNGEPNFNHQAYIGLSRQYMRDSLAVMRHAPDAYLKGVGKATAIYFRSSSDYGLLEGNRRRIDAWDRLYNTAFYGAWTWREPFWSKAPLPEGASVRDRLAHDLANTGWLLLVGLPLLWAFGALAIVRRCRAGRWTEGLTLAFVLSTVLFATAVGNLLDVGENNRFRFDVDPLHAVLFALAAQAAWRRLRTGSR